MLNFDLCTPTRVCFGRGRENEAGALIAAQGARRPLVCYGGGSALRSGLIDRVRASIEAAGLECVLLGGVQANPTAEFASYTARFAAEKGCDFLLAVGGGSVIDNVKMAAYCVRTGWEPWDVTTHKVTPAERLGVGVILTIAATGSETSNSAVLTNEGLKRGFSSDLNRPDFAIMNPELTFTLPPYQTACGVVDILMHTMERYMCTNEDNALVDELSEGLLRTVIAAGRRAMAQPDDYEARAALMYAGSLSHNGLTGAGRECGLWAHKLEHEMSGLRPEIAHGAGLAVVWPAYLEFFAARGAGEARLLRYAQRIWGIDPDFEHPERSVRAGIEATRAYFAELGMPKTLRELGLREEDIAVMSGKCTDNGAKILPAILPLGRAETEEIFRMCL